MPSNPATVLDLLSIEVANIVARAAEEAHPRITELLDDGTEFTTQSNKLTLRAKAAHARLLTWPEILPFDWAPISLSREQVSADIIKAGFYGNSCDMYPDVSISGLWNRWRAARLKLLCVIADHQSFESQLETLFEIQQVVDDIFASVPFNMGSKVEAAGMWDAEFVYPNLPGQSVSLGHYHSAAAFGGVSLWYAFESILGVSNYLHSDQRDFAVKQIRRIGTCYDARMPSESELRELRRDQNVRGPPLP